MSDDDTDLGHVLDKHQFELEALSSSLLDGNAEGFAQGMVELLTNLATQVPILGALAKRAVAKAFASSSNAKLMRDLAAIEREEDRQRFADQIAGPIEEMIGQALLQLTRTQHSVTEDVIEALGGLREEFEVFRAHFAKEVSAASVIVDQILVSDKGIGIRVTSRTTKTAKVGSIHVSGKGVGIDLD